MKLNHPLEFLPVALRRPLFFVFLGLTVVMFLIFNQLDLSLRTSAAPSGIVSFELAGTVEKAQAMMDSWDASARLVNAFGLGFDFLFMPVYATALSLGILLALGTGASAWGGLGRLLGWGAYAATLFDSTENFALFTILNGKVAAPYPQLAAACATIKFTLIILGLVYGLVGGFMAASRRFWPRK
jgi:hypothetical protein